MRNSLYLIPFFAAILLTSGSRALAQENALRALEADLQAISDSVRPSIVKITIPSRTFPELPGESRREIRPRRRPDVHQPQRDLKERERTLLGILVDDEGYILTSYQIDDALRPQVELSDGRVLEAKVIGVDRGAHIGLLKIDADDIEPIRMGSSEGLRQGSLVVIFGNSCGFFNSLSLGVVSGQRREIGGASLIQVSALLNPGDEAALVVDADGKMVGMVDSIWSRRLQPFGKIKFFCWPGEVSGRIEEVPAPLRKPRMSQGRSQRNDIEPEGGDLNRVFEETADAVREAGKAAQKFIERFGGRIEDRPIGGGIVAEGIGFVRPIEDLLDVVRLLKKGRPVRKGYLGVVIGPLAEEVRAQIPALGDRVGVVVREVMPGSPADLAGIRVWDIVVAVDDRPFRSIEHFRRIIQSSTGEITLTVIRKGKEKEIAVELEER